MDFEDAASRIESRAALLRNGVTRRDISTGGVHRIARGGFVPHEAWAEAWPNERHLLQVAAFEERRRGGPVVYSHLTAAVLHGLPLWGAAPARVHLSGSHHNGAVTRGAPLVSRHRCAIPDADVAAVGRLTATSLARTLADVLRTAPVATAIVMADAAMRRVAGDDSRRAYDSDAADELRGAVARRLRPGARGVCQAREVLDLADGRSESPGESVSRWRLHEIGFAPPRLQVRIPGPGAGAYFVDFGLDDADVWGEYDGEVKYRVEEMRRGAALDELISAEKAREDWIRGVTGRRLVRWSTADIRTTAALRTKLAHFRVFPTPSRGPSHR